MLFPSTSDLMNGREGCPFGETLLPTLIDTISKNDPDRPFAEISWGGNGDYRSVNVRQFATSIDKAAWWLTEKYGKGDGNTTYVAYAGPQDPRYLVLLLAGAKSGNIMFFPSPRNSTEANVSLLGKYKCSRLVIPSGPVFRNMLKGTIEESKLQVTEVPELEWFLPSTTTHDPIPLYPWDRPFKTAKYEPLLGVHTSGSTGIPKPIIQVHGLPASTDTCNGLQPPITRSYFLGKRILNGFPLFHMAGIDVANSAITFPTTMIFPPSHTPLTADVVRDMILTKNIQVAFLPPFSIVELVSTDEGLACIEKLDYLYTGSGALPSDIINLVKDKTHLITDYGGSEIGLALSEMPEAEDAGYFKFSPLFGYEMREFAPGLHELVMIKRKELEDYQCIFMMFPNIEEWKTNDLFSKHSSKNGLWKHEGRADDIVVLSTGEKFNPTTLEDALNGHPEVRTAIVAGYGRFQGFLLVEPARTIKMEVEKAELVEKIWPIMQRENAKGSAAGRVLRDMVIVATSEKPFPRTAKASVQRAATLALYKEEIDKLYKGLEEEATDMRRNSFDPNSKDDLTEFFLKTIFDTSGLHVKFQQNLFESGLDSLGVLALVRAAKTISKADPSKTTVSAKAIYDCGSVDRLVQYITTGTIDSAAGSEAEMQRLYEKHIANLPPRSQSKKPQPIANGKVVLLTGSTGSLGSYILHTLLHDPSVQEVICLNRTSDAQDRQIHSMTTKGLCANFKLKPTTFYQVDLSAPNLGLHCSQYKFFLQRATHIIHNAWHIDFNKPLSYFEVPHISGIRSLIDFSVSSVHNAKICFISSFGSVMETSSSSIPESIVTDWSAAGTMGYPQSKLIAERILDTASTHCGIETTLVRVGQIAGPSSSGSSSGCWPKTEWLPSLLTSSKHIGCLPRSIGSLDGVAWIPVDEMAKIVVELASNGGNQDEAEGGETKVYNAINPEISTWQDLVPALTKKMGLGESVPLPEWIKAMSEGSEDAAVNPALRLLDFFQGLCDEQVSGEKPVEMEESMKVSSTLRGLKAVDDQAMELWARQLGLM